MTKPTTTLFYLFIAALLLVFLLLWIGSVALLFWDTRRRGLGRWERWLGIGLSIGVPIAGFFAYWIIILISRWMRPAPQPQENPIRRVTQPMPVMRSPGVRTTIPAAEMLQPTVPLTTPDLGIKPATNASKPVYQMTVLEGPNSGMSFHLTSFPVGIGRSSAALVLLDKDLKVSRQHAEIYESHDALRIRDLGSLHGTRVNGLKIQDQFLRSGDQIQLGSTVLIFQVSKE